MRLYAAQVPIIAREMIRSLLEAELIELEEGSDEEAELDVVGVLREYVRVEREINRKARELSAGDGNEQRIRRRLAKEMHVGIGDDAVEYVVGQLIETFLHSHHVAEVFGSDRELRAVLQQILKRLARDRSDELDVAVRSKLKNLEEGSSAWEVEYEKALAQMKRIRGLDG
jgi:hypothetical protein